VTDFDDLDVLERELGPSLRIALRRVAAEIREEQQSHAPWLSGIGSAAPGVGFDDVAGDLVPLEPEGSEVMIVDLGLTPTKRGGHRRSLVVVAAAALVLIAGSVLVWAAVDDDVDTRVPVGPDRTSTTDAPDRPKLVMLPPEHTGDRRDCRRDRVHPSPWSAR
jgi:hypothetical protein